jgi:hypothetical protein
MRFLAKFKPGKVIRLSTDENNPRRQPFCDSRKLLGAVRKAKSFDRKVKCFARKVICFSPKPKCLTRKAKIPRVQGNLLQSQALKPCGQTSMAYMQGKIVRT